MKKLFLLVLSISSPAAAQSLGSASLCGRATMTQIEIFGGHQYVHVDRPTDDRVEINTVEACVYMVDLQPSGLSYDDGKINFRLTAEQLRRKGYSLEGDPRSGRFSLSDARTRRRLDAGGGPAAQDSADTILAFNRDRGSWRPEPEKLRALAEKFVGLAYKRCYVPQSGAGTVCLRLKGGQLLGLSAERNGQWPYASVAELNDTTYGFDLEKERLIYPPETGSGQGRAVSMRDGIGVLGELIFRQDYQRHHGRQPPP